MTGANFIFPSPLWGDDMTVHRPKSRTARVSPSIKAKHTVLLSIWSFRRRLTVIPELQWELMENTNSLRDAKPLSGSYVFIYHNEHCIVIDTFSWLFEVLTFLVCIHFSFFFRFSICRDNTIKCVFRNAVNVRKNDYTFYSLFSIWFLLKRRW